MGALSFLINPHGPQLKRSRLEGLELFISRAVVFLPRGVIAILLDSVTNNGQFAQSPTGQINDIQMK
jgi:hypothetical protein